MVTHSFLNQDGSIYDSNGGYGANKSTYLWSRLSDLPNVVMTFSAGHAGSAASGVLPTADGHRAMGFLQAYHDNTYNPTRIVTVNVGAGTIQTHIVASWNRVNNQAVSYIYPEDNVTITGMDFTR